MKYGLIMCSLAFAAASISGASVAFAGDAAIGQQLAQAHCANCHIIARHQRNEVAVSPPFETIARKVGFNSERLVNLLVSPHRKMNFALTPSEADDIAAYMSTLRE